MEKAGKTPKKAGKTRGGLVEDRFATEEEMKVVFQWIEDNKDFLLALKNF